MSGAKIEGEITLLVNNKKELTPQGHFLQGACKGDILFTDYGVSGFAVLDISQGASVALMEHSHAPCKKCPWGVSISINLLPNFNAQKLSSHISSIAINMPDFTIADILTGLLPIKIVNGILDDLEISTSTCSEEIGTKLSKKIANRILDWRFEVKETHGFRHAEVAGGGVDTTEINPKTFESLKQKNLYFCGEVLDVVGKRGGYNFAFAWASGYAAAKAISRG